ncbi:MAG: hypothetical protein ACLQPH_15820 [Acidimicrobiales bacterium]
MTDEEIMFAAIVDHPGASLRHFRQSTPAIKGGDHARDAALKCLVEAGKVRIESVGQKRARYAV